MHPLVFLVCTVALLLPFAIATTSALRSLDNPPVLHFTLARRGGKFTPIEHELDHINMTYLAQELERTEGRFNLTQRQVKGKS